jgi:AraC-like DNA-binding protein
VQYGLIAEEVDRIYPELVIRDDSGRIQGVRYDELAPMLLNEMQKQERINAAQAAKIASLEQQLAAIQAALVKLLADPFQRRRVMEFLNAKLSDDITLAELAREFDLSLSHFARAFKNSVGTSPHAWLTRRRARETPPESHHPNPDADCARVRLFS